MAFIQMNIMSESLMRTVPVNVILPADKLPVPGEPPREDRPFKTLYLLHGIIGSSIDWVNGTRIQRFAEDHDLAVVMPSGSNSFYVDQPEGHNYFGRFVGQELVSLTRKIFPLSTKREDTYIGGLSMGGFGALRSGLKYTETFSHIVCLSGALLAEEMARRTGEKESFMDGAAYARACFGDLDKILHSDKNPKWLVKQLKEQNRPIPRILLACGQEDDLLPYNEDMRDFLLSEGVDVTYQTGEGAHEWDFWDRWIEYAVSHWLPLEETTMGLSSGHIGKK